ncbi:dephospho-CoA kinase [Thermoplasma sp.]|uniref:dephospho-CoA kinase n=1 Tax=Thermoplasma sp. TaxID=1973142 RepID=UPI00126E6C3B|nr:dephospho-CoA kinase [Thermoplasma sp.]KAA8922691.1 MAG: flagellar hook-basal body complex protein FliE [Thermoplasma sp.]
MIVVTGMPGAGKDEFVKVARSLGFMDLHMGNTVREFAKRAGIPEIDHEIGSFATSERKKYGMDIWAVRTAEKITDDGRTVIDGLRNYEELQYFSRFSENPYVVAIFASRKDRFSRIVKRDRPDDIRTMEELIERDTRELSWGIGNVIALADYMIVNDDTLETFHERCRKLLTEKFSISNRV